MTELSKWAPSDMLEPVRRFLDGDLSMTPSMKVEQFQDGTTADMIFSVEQIVWHLSQYLALEPGDLVLTGTPQGVALSGRFPYLSANDVVEIEIDGLGRQRQRFVAWEDAR